jgi:hypothetical protein
VTAPLREPEAESEAIEIWPPEFEFGPELIADRIGAAHTMRKAAMHRVILSGLGRLVRLFASSRLQ